MQYNLDHSMKDDLVLVFSSDTLSYQIKLPTSFPHLSLKEFKTKSWRTAHAQPHLIVVQAPKEIKHRNALVLCRNAVCLCAHRGSTLIISS